MTESMDIPIVCCPLVGRSHVSTLVSVDIAVSACAVRVVVDVFYSGRRLLGVVEVSGTMGHGSLPPGGSWLKHLGVATVIETDVGVTTSAIGVVDAGLSHNLENARHFIVQHAILLYNQCYL